MVAQETAVRKAISSCMMARVGIGTIRGGRDLGQGRRPVRIEEAERRVADPEHAWYGRWLRRAKTYKAMNAMIQGSAARHTKLWMRACYREGIVPLLQMHDALDSSVTSPEQGELIARLGEEAVKLEVPMRVELKFGRSWGDAKHTWEELHGTAPAATKVVPAQPQGGDLGGSNTKGTQNSAPASSPAGRKLSTTWIAPKPTSDRSKLTSARNASSIRRMGGNSRDS